MPEIECIQGRLHAAGRRFGIVAARFNHRIVDLLTAGAIDCLSRHGADDKEICVVQVPGAWELPAALEELAATESYDGLVALAVVIRGETAHFDYICQESSRGIARVGTRYRIPIGFGVLTCEDSDQAMERAGGKAGNKGWEAALATIEMADLVSRLRETDPQTRRHGSPAAGRDHG